MNQHFPYLEPIVVCQNELRVTRRFTAAADILVRDGQRVQSGDVIGRIEPRLVATRISIADQMDISPADVKRHLMKPVGSTFAAGEAIARMRRGMRGVVVTTPIAGTLIEIDNDSGHGLIAPAEGGEVHALVPGDVEHIERRQSVVIRTVGSRVLGILGLGKAVSGPLRVLAAQHDASIQPDQLTPDVADTILVIGGSVPSSVFQRAIQLGARAVVTGAVNDRELGQALGWKGEDRLALWRPMPAAPHIGAGIETPITVMATEGFGVTPMHPEIFAALREHDGQFAVLLPETRVMGPTQRPELIIPDETLLDNDAEITRAVPTEGRSIRMIDQANLGRPATLASAPYRASLRQTALVDAVDVSFLDGGSATVPLSNIEIVA